MKNGNLLCFGRVPTPPALISPRFPTDALPSPYTAVYRGALAPAAGTLSVWFSTLRACFLPRRMHAWPSRSPLSLLPAGFTEVAGWDVDSVAGWLALINQKESVDAFRGESRRSTPNPCPQEPNNKTPLHCDSWGLARPSVRRIRMVSPHRQSLDGTKWPLARRGQSKRATPTSPRIDTGHHPLPPPPPPSLPLQHSRL